MSEKRRYENGQMCMKTGDYLVVLVKRNCLLQISL